ncbi:hypothetical protein AMJ44_07080 [candidate division WOR-1 bacterium DG_54_3]|uniref:Uncharacterized protein n=1 Tax=candidate division WOR-1 bacterium DG_54_3 TaxID=1703775 RepID=A0A0S7Y101_UNCSA|nr:MAG: hypothetical protein AMJ44_07080 [candidate division WOR-1 bacterium DG_54_3]
MIGIPPPYKVFSTIFVPDLARPKTTIITCIDAACHKEKHLEWIGTPGGRTVRLKATGILDR